MVQNGSWILQDLRQQCNFDFDVVMMPQGIDGKRYVACTGGGWAIASTCPQPDEVWEFLREFAGHEGARKFVVESNRSLPSYVSLIPEWLNVATNAYPVPSNVKVFANTVLNYAHNPPLVPIAYGQVLYQFYQDLYGPNAQPVANVVAGIEQELNLMLQDAKR